MKESNGPLEPAERLRRHVELMGEAAIWAGKAQDAFQAGDRKLADRHLKRAESFLVSARELES